MPDGLSLNLTAVAAKFQSDMGRYAQRVRTDGSKATRDQMTNVRQVLIATSPVDTGFLQAHWGPIEEASTGTQIVFRVENPTEYGPILEYGGYRRVGPKTVALGGGDLGQGFVAAGGIYSQQAPLGWVRRALAGAWPQYRLRLNNVIRQAWPYTLGPGSDTGPLGGDLGALFGIDLAGGTDTGGLSQGTQATVREVLGSLRSRRGGRA